MTTQLRSDAVDKMAGIFTKRVCQPNDLKIDKKNCETQTGGQAKIWGACPTQAPLESPLVWSYTQKIRVKTHTFASAYYEKGIGTRSHAQKRRRNAVPTCSRSTTPLPGTQLHL